MQVFIDAPLWEGWPAGTAYATLVFDGKRRRALQIQRGEQYHDLTPLSALAAGVRMLSCDDWERRRLVDAGYEMPGLRHRDKPE